MPSAIDQEIRDLTDSFIAELRDVVGRAAVASVSEAFGNVRAAAARPSTPPSRARAADVSTAPAGRVAKKRNGLQRDAGDLAKLVERLGAFIAKTPGKRIEEIAKAMGMSTNEPKLPAKKLIEAKRVTTKGRKRATAYFSN